MKFNELETFVTNFKYKPTTVLKCALSEVTNGVELTLLARVFDSDNPKERCTRKCRAHIGFKQLERMDEKEMLSYVRDLIMMAERHEVDEWIQYCGKKVFDPHFESKIF